MKKQIKSKNRRIRTAAVTALLVTGTTLSLTSCGTAAWDWLWSRDGNSPIIPGDLVVDVTLGEDEWEDLFANAVEYTGDPHAGTEILYEGYGENRDRIIVIDAGHQAKASSETEPLGPYPTGTPTNQIEMKAEVSQGGADDFNGIPEYELNLQVALRLRNVLISRGYSVLMIRETNDVNISNKERAQIANKYNAAAFVRIHANGDSDATRRGAMTVCQTKNNPFAGCAAAYEESRRLSEVILEYYCSSTRMNTDKNLPIWETDTMAGTNWSDVPTTIVEMGYMSNREDADLMSTDEFRRRAATGIADGLDAFFAAMDDSTENPS